MSTPREILDELAATPGAARDRLRTAEDGTTLVDALRLATDDHAKMILCDVLGFRHEAVAVDELIACLSNPSSKVRSSAADALAKIGDPRAGAALLERFELPEPSLGVRRMLLSALGAVQHRAAIPMLINWLGNPDADQRGAAAWSLGVMGAREALAPLEEAERAERITYAKERIREAIARIRTGNAT